ncbi:hypothetical protein THRCLA_21396 [Thraustotheca clavata]|uniref:Uncharacterized protein n=1 Tax=Thraustotheca clavata TaxID=74557 RepID=A0A1V9ZX24_9STRA|nr:hypothetical protein THRCLA_21396 [Thraustotheca clavata]
MQYYGHGVEKNVENALKYLHQAANRQHREAQFTLGMLYFQGKGITQYRCRDKIAWTLVPQNNAIAFSYLKPSADAGNADAQWMLGTLFNHGNGVPLNLQKATELFTASMHGGNARGTFHLGTFFMPQGFVSTMGIGTMHEYGRHVARDFTRAAALYASAATQDVPEAAFYLGLMYMDGRGVEKHYDLAMINFKKASDLGFASAKYYIGLLYVSGTTIVDYHQALNWFEQAALSNDPAISKKAFKAAKQLKTLLEQVDQHQKDVYAQYVK